MRLQNFSMAGAVALVGVGLIAHSAALVFSSLGNSAQAGVGAAAPAVASAAMGQAGAERHIVWYGNDQLTNWDWSVLFRAWSDGTVEMRRIQQTWGGNPCGNAEPCMSPWFVIASPQEGLAAFADLDSNGKVDAIDLGSVLSRWGDAPRNDIPPSDCPLNLINP